MAYFKNSIGYRFISIAILLLLICGFSSCKHNKAPHNDYAIPVDTTNLDEDSINENKDTLSSVKEESSDNSSRSVHVNVSSHSSESSSDGYKVDGMSGFDPNYEDPDNNHDMDYYMNETDDEWAN